MVKNPHPAFHVAKLEHKTSLVPFIVTLTEIHCDFDVPDITFGKNIFCYPYSGRKYNTSFQHKNVLCNTIFRPFCYIHWRF